MNKSGSVIQYKTISGLLVIISLLASLIFMSFSTVLNSGLVIAVGAPEADMGKIVFCSNRDGNQEIYIMDADGTNQTRLTNNSATDAHPQLSADGRRIVFDSDSDGNQEIYVMSVDGSNQTRLTNNTFVDVQPAWSPDGTKIAFSSTRSGTPQIWIMNADGSDPVQLTIDPYPDNQGGWSVRCYTPDWSYDGTRIAFRSIRFTNLDDISVINADGSNLAAIASGGGMIPSITEPGWSPDNMHIAVSRTAIGEAQGYNGRIMAMDSNGSGGVFLSSTNFDYAPSYSPDGSRIAFFSTRDGNAEIYVVNADGSGETRITDNTADDSYPAWGPTAGNVTGDTIVVFPDAELEAAIREAIGKSQGDIYQSDLMGLTRLYAYGRGIADLTGLEHCTSLTWLDLNGNQLSDIEPLVNNQGLGQGDTVYLEDNPLSATDISEYILVLEGRGVNVHHSNTTHYLTMAVSGNCTTSPSAGIHTYTEGTVVNITATNGAAGCRFVNWSGDVADPNSVSTTVTMDGDKTVTANFEASNLMAEKTGGIPEEAKDISSWIWFAVIFGGMAVLLIIGGTIIVMR